MSNLKQLIVDEITRAVSIANTKYQMFPNDKLGQRDMQAFTDQMLVALGYEKPHRQGDPIGGGSMKSLAEETWG